MDRFQQKAKVTPKSATMKTTRVFKSLEEWRSFRASSEFLGKTLGFAPTMGALHEGHASLVRKSASENDRTLVSIFVNPTQFNDPKDLEKYPRTLEKDLAVLEEAGADYLIYPTFEDMYRDGYRYQISEKEFSKVLCGAHRPGHFDGVLTVVMKLLNLAQARRAYFGEKDFQQLELIRGMAQAFFLPVEIVGCPTLRENDGLAMSSRNLNLSATEREKAPLLARELRKKGSPADVRTRLENLGFKVDYVEELKGRRFVAAFLGSVRLIDNISLSEVEK
jgi:pantoate--beta-alanine ligase